MTMPVIWERCSEWGDGAWALKVDLRDALGSIRYDSLWQALQARVGAEAAIDVLKVSPGMTCIRSGRRCVAKQQPPTRGAEGGPGSLVLWNIALDEAMGDFMRSWQARKLGIRLPNLTGAGGGAHATKAMGRSG